MSVEELISLSYEHLVENTDAVKHLDLSINSALHLNTTDVLLKYFYDYYCLCFPEIPRQAIVDCIIRSCSSVELFSVLHYVIDGYLKELDYL